MINEVQLYFLSLSVRQMGETTETLLCVVDVAMC